MMLEETKFDLTDEMQETHWIYTQLQHKDSGNMVSLLNIYVPVNYNKESMLGIH